MIGRESSVTQRDNEKLETDTAPNPRPLLVLVTRNSLRNQCGNACRRLVHKYPTQNPTRLLQLAAWRRYSPAPVSFYFDRLCLMQALCQRYELCLHRLFDLRCSNFGIGEGINVGAGNAPRKNFLASAHNFPIPVATVWHCANLKWFSHAALPCNRRERNRSLSHRRLAYAAAGDHATMR